MYIHSISIEGFRNFTQAEVRFRQGVNVIIGHNNAGKSNLLRALSLVLDVKTPKKLEIDDFNQSVSLRELLATPPSVKIQVTIHQSEGEPDDSDDLVTVSNWLNTLTAPYEAKLTYEFFLPDSNLANYRSALSPATTNKEAWRIIKHEFIRLYVGRIYGGDPTLKSVADHDSLSKFDYQFLNAIRDVERDMFTGRNTLLREVLDFFIDYEIKIDGTKDDQTRRDEIKAKNIDFAAKAKELLGMLQQRMKPGQKEILEYANETGASFENAEPDFDGSISETELYSALRLIIKYTVDIEVPATHNGLGYNNLIFMSLLLAKMQVDTNGDYLGSNAKVFPILVIEEPEAHLHPAMQYKFLKYLRSSTKNKARQAFVTSHSTHITSAVSLDEIICLSQTGSGLSVGYPGKVFSNTPEDKASKAYVQRFLDATKCDMLFAKSVVMVEGVAEQLLMSTIAKYCGDDTILEDRHVSVISIGGRYFEHFLKLFDTANPRAINKKVACITDVDPESKPKNTNEKFKSCYPFEYLQDASNFDYQDHSGTLVAQYSAHPNIRFFSQNVTTGKTLEYELARVNPTCPLLLTESLSNKPEIRELMQLKIQSKTLADIEAAKTVHSSKENTRIIQSLTNNTALTADQKVVNLLAARYLNSVSKGIHALELSQALEENLKAVPRVAFTVPSYLSNAINWVC